MAVSYLDVTPQEELRAKAWIGFTRLVMALVLFGGGFAIGYYQYGDAIELRVKVKQKQDRIVDLENDRETASTQIAKINRDKDICAKGLKACKGGAAPAPAAAAPAAK